MNKWVLIFFFIALAFALVCGPLMIPLLKKMHASQTVRDNGPQTHLSKNGTPTIGGVIFLIPMLVLSLIAFFTGLAKEILPLIITTVLYSAVGFLDDFLKVRKKNKDGLLWYQKLIALIVISVLLGLYLQFWGPGTKIDIPFFGLHGQLDLRFMYVPFCVFVMVAESNAVNITDGLDGLCAGSMTIVMLFFSVISIVYAEEYSAAIFSAITVGSLIGFLAYNIHPAKVFMGDTGSLALGAALGAVGIHLKLPFILVFAGLLFVIEALSVLLQVAYFKITHGKRLFKMSPIHHHFELSGWKETTVVFVFWAFTLVCCIGAYFCVIL